MKPAPAPQQQPTPADFAALEARVAALEALLVAKSASPPSGKWLTAKEAAFRANLSEGRIHQLARAKKINSAKFCGHRFIDLASLDHYKITPSE